MPSLGSIIIADQLTCPPTTIKRSPKGFLPVFITSSIVCLIVSPVSPRKHGKCFEQHKLQHYLNVATEANHCNKPMRRSTHTKTLPVKKKEHWSLWHPNLVLIVFYSASLHHLANFEILDTVHEGDNLMNFTNEKQYFFGLNGSYEDHSLYLLYNVQVQTNFHTIET